MTTATDELFAGMDRHRQLVMMLPDPADLTLMDGVDLIEALGQIELISAEMTVSSIRQRALLQRLESEPK